MKNVIDVMINGEIAHVFEDSIERLKEAGFEVEPIIYDEEDLDPHLLIDVRYEKEQKRGAEEWEKKLNEIEYNSKESIFTKIVETLVEMPELYGYVLGVVATVSSIIAVVINYHFYGKLYERFHNKKK